MDLQRIRLFETPAADAGLLIRWRGVPLTYRPGQALPGSHVDHYEERLASSASQAAFRRAAELLLRYRFYPDDVMAHASDFEREGRRMRAGDRIVQRIRLFPFVDVITMNEVTHVSDDGRSAGFTYCTTDKHDEIGAWSARLDWTAGGALVLQVDAIGLADLPAPLRPFARRLQLRAHRRGIDFFRAAACLPS